MENNFFESLWSPDVRLFDIQQLSVTAVKRCLSLFDSSPCPFKWKFVIAGVDTLFI